MRALFGVVGLLLTLAIVGIVAVKQLNAVGRSVGAAPGASASSSTAASTTPSTAPGANVAEQSRQLQDKLRSDVVKSLEQGAARNDEAAK